MRQHHYLRSLLGRIILALLMILMYQPGVALSSTVSFSSINEAAMKLVQFCIDPKVGLDEDAVAALVDYVLSSKESREHALPKSLESTGAYYEFDTKTAFPRLIEYVYNPLIPSAVTGPSSLRYSVWTTAHGETQNLPDSWKPVPPAGVPVVIHGMEHASNTPDLSTGAYHEYDLKRTRILLNHKGRQVLVSISKQIGTSKVGKKVSFWAMILTGTTTTRDNPVLRWLVSDGSSHTFTTISQSVSGWNQVFHQPWSALVFFTGFAPAGQE
jgi:hypothetical protein